MIYTTDISKVGNYPLTLRAYYTSKENYSTHDFSIEIYQDPCETVTITISEDIFEWSPERLKSNITYTLGEDALIAKLNPTAVSMDRSDITCPDYKF